MTQQDDVSNQIDLKASPSSERPSIGGGLGYVEQVQELMRLPQHLCKQRGICCKVAIYKGSLSWEETLAIANNPDAEGHESARDFVSVFKPYPNQEAAKAVAENFVERAREQVDKRSGNPDNISFSYCRYLLEDGRCGVHEDRPIGCRVYPFPHPNTIFHPGCGFEAQGVKNWHKIEALLADLESLK